MSETNILNTSWFNFPAITLENERILVTIVPDLGAKIVSLFDKIHRHEWLVPPMRPPQKTEFGAEFVSQDMGGWDEMMPTIIPCTWNGRVLPDHGEVWNVPWQVESLAGEVALSVKGKTLPYELKRSAVLTTPGCLELRYSLIHNGSTPFPYLWAAHPQFVVGLQTRIVFPPEVKQVVNVVVQDAMWGNPGDRHAWPTAVAANGQSLNLDRVRSIEHHACRKFYVPPEQSVGWAGLVDEESGCELHLSWSPTDLPYLGLWVDEGAYQTHPVAAPEPTTAYYDSLETAIRNGKAPILNPGEEKHWTLNVILK